MRIARTTDLSKGDSHSAAAQLITEQLSDFVSRSFEDEMSLHEFERGLFDRLLKIGFEYVEQYLGALDEGDQGETVVHAETTHFRSAKPSTRRLRTIFGEHEFSAFVYRVRADEKSAIGFRPVDRRLGIGPEKYSPLLQEFSMLFCTDQAFATAAKTLETIFGQRTSVDTLERISRVMGSEAGDFMDALPVPAGKDEGEYLVVTADGKGVPMVRDDAQHLKACDPRPERPGNRRMVTLASVYSTDRHEQTACGILAALFSDMAANPSPTSQRPLPQNKRYTARFTEFSKELGQVATGAQRAMAWAERQVEERHQPNQKLIVIMDGQHSLWDCAAASRAAVEQADVVEILDLLHACSYIWKAAKALFKNRSARQDFVIDKLTAILNGRVASVIRSFRSRSTRGKLSGEKKKDVESACRYFSAHRHRMNYNEYLAAGYPIATGVIEGACRHIVKDRMERSGMKWTQTGAQAMLNLRCLRASDMWDNFQKQRNETRCPKNGTLNV